MTSRCLSGAAIAAADGGPGRVAQISMDGRWVVPGGTQGDDNVASAMTWIALLRGINVGGRNTLPMADLRLLLEAAGFDGVRTYIQRAQP